MQKQILTFREEHEARKGLWTRVPQTDVQLRQNGGNLDSRGHLCSYVLLCEISLFLKIGHGWVAFISSIDMVNCSSPTSLQGKGGWGGMSCSPSCRIEEKL